MINSSKIQRAYSEVYSFINALGDNYINKIPKFIYDTLNKERDINYNPTYEANKNISNKEISYEGLALISAISLQYFCDNQLEKDEFKRIYINNTKLKDEKFSYDNLFKRSVKNESITSDALVKYKEGVLTKFINKIRSFFKRGK